MAAFGMFAPALTLSGLRRAQAVEKEVDDKIAVKFDVSGVIRNGMPQFAEDRSSRCGKFDYANDGEVEQRGIHRAHCALLYAFVDYPRISS